MSEAFKLQWIHQHEIKSLHAVFDGRRVAVGFISQPSRTVTVYMRSWRMVLGLPLIGKKEAEIVYDTAENPELILVDFLRTMLPAGMPLPAYLPDVDERKPPEETEYTHEMVSDRSYSELETSHRFRVLLQLHDLLEGAAKDEPGWSHEDSRFVLKTMLRELTLR